MGSTGSGKTCFIHTIAGHVLSAFAWLRDRFFNGFTSSLNSKIGGRKSFGSEEGRCGWLGQGGLWVLTDDFDGVWKLPKQLLRTFAKTLQTSLRKRNSQCRDLPLGTRSDLKRVLARIPLFGGVWKYGWPVFYPKCCFLKQATSQSLGTSWWAGACHRWCSWTMGYKRRWDRHCHFGGLSPDRRTLQDKGVGLW